ncbi:MAG: hypothetical protein ABSH29_17530 [Acidimicrobiales bacterium]
MDCGFVTFWKMPYPGREKQALDLGLEVVEYWGRLAAEGKCSEPDWFFFSDHGMWVTKGDPDTLREIVETEEVQRILAKGNLFLDGYGYEFVKTGDAATAQMTRYAEVGQEVGLI